MYNEKCEIIASSFSQILPYKTAKVYFFFELKKSNNILLTLQMNLTIMESKLIFQQKINIDLCSRKQPDMIRMLSAICGVPSRCPISSNLTLIRNNENFGKISKTAKKALQVISARRFDHLLKIKIQHDTGFSCFNIELDITNSA